MTYNPADDSKSQTHKTTGHPKMVSDPVVDPPPSSDAFSLSSSTPHAVDPPAADDNGKSSHVVKHKGSSKSRFVIMAVVAILAITLPVSVYLAQQSQEIRQRALAYPECPAGTCEDNNTPCDNNYGNPGGICGPNARCADFCQKGTCDAALCNESDACGYCTFNGCTKAADGTVGTGCTPHCNPNITAPCQICCSACNNCRWCFPPSASVPPASNPPASNPPPPPPPEAPDCTSLTTTADLNNLKIGVPITFTLTATGASTIDHVGIVAYENSCSYTVTEVSADAQGPGSYNMTWTPAAPGKLTIWGRVWNDAIAECRADCVDQPPRYLCAHAASCKLQANVTSTSPSPSPAAQCTNVKLYQVTGDINNAANWQLLTTQQLTALKPGNIVYATTLGSVTNGTFDKARIRVNSSLWTVANETTNKKPGSDEFYISYNLPAGVTAFAFEAEIHEVNSDKWY